MRISLMAALLVCTACSEEPGTRDEGPGGDGPADGTHDGAPADHATGDGAAMDAGPVDGALPCTIRLVEPVASASVIPAPAGPVPAPGAPFTIPQTGVQVTRISDVADTGAGGATYFTNGYSRWSAANVTGSHVTAFGSSVAVVYQLSTRSIVRTLTVGEPNELHWDSSNAAGTQTTIYYRKGAQLRRIEVTGGTDELVHDFTKEYPGAQQVLNGVEGAPSTDMRYWAFQVCTGMTGGGQCTGILDVVVYDKQQDSIVGKLASKHSGFPTPNFVDMSPSGSRIVVGSCAGGSVPFNGMYAWSRDFGSYVRINTDCAHSGWAWGAGGEELFVSTDPCGKNNSEVTFSCDYTMSVDVNDPGGWDARTPILSSAVLGWGNGTHFGRVYDPKVRGWFFVSTYSSGTSNWGTDQLFFVELKKSPRVFRVTPTLNTYSGYWSEAFASLDFSAQHVYWGANWGGQDNLELYRADLCTGWWQKL